MLTPAFLATTTSGAASLTMLLAVATDQDEHSKALYALAGVLGTIAMFALKALIAERKTRDTESKEREKDAVKRIRQVEDERINLVTTFTEAMQRNTAAIEKLTNELRSRTCPYVGHTKKHED